MDGANGQTGGNNRSSTFVVTAFISFGRFNVFHICIAPLIEPNPDKCNLPTFELSLCLVQIKNCTGCLDGFRV